MGALMRIIDWICNTLAVLAGVYLVLIMLGIVFQATVRTIGFSGSSHIFTFSEYGLLYIVMAASPWLVRIKGHVYIELLTAALPKAITPIFSRGVAMLCVLICLCLAYYAYGSTMRAYKFGDADMRSLDYPKWLLLVSMPICFGLMAVNFLRFVFGQRTLHTGEAGVHE